MTKILSRIALCLGVILVIGALALLIITRVSVPQNEKNAKEIVSEMYGLMPDVKNAYPDGKGDTVMPSMELDGTDFSGIITIPLYETELPVCNEWNKDQVGKYPHRFTGSVYDNSLIIGGSDNVGQFDFMKNISVGDYVSFTDTTGGCFSFTVSSIDITDDVSLEQLTSNESDLTFFARNSYGFDYTIVRCKLK